MYIQKMPPKILCLPFFLIIIFLCSSCDKKIASKNINTNYISIQGEKISLFESSPKYTIINYWATWCSPCRDEIIEFNNFIKSTNNQLNVVGVTLEPLEYNTLKTALENLNISYPIVTVDIMNELFAIETEVFPTTYIINSHGDLVKSISGPISSKQLEEYTS